MNVRRALMLAVMLLAFGSGAARAWMCMSVVWSNQVGAYVMTWRSNAGIDPTTCSWIAISGTEWATYEGYAAQIAALNTSVTTLQGDVSQLQVVQSAQASDISALQSQVNSLVASLNNISGAMSAPFDYVLAGQIFAWFFSGVVVLFLVSRGAGTVLAGIKRW